MAPQETAKFVTGSTMRHVLTMTGTASIGLMSIFLVDVLNLLYISMLGEEELAAAIGYSGTLMFFLTSVAIGLTIATTAQVSRTLGRGDKAMAAELGGAGLALMAVTMAGLTLLAMIYAKSLAEMLGAEGRTLELTVRFMHIVLPSMPVMAVGMSAAGLLRAKGDAKRAMYVTLIAGAVTAALDPLFIFVFKLGIDGAAIVTVISRFVLVGIGFYGVVRVHNMVSVPRRQTLIEAARPYFAIGLPAIMTQLATPVGNAYVTREISTFGDAAVAGWAIIGRLTPLAFGAIFALSGAIGPILGQNFGARQFDRVQQTMRGSLVVMFVYVLVIWALLALFRHQISGLFGAEGTSADLIHFFCLIAAGSFLFNGMLFVANAAFNNLGFPLYSTVSNWSRSTLGVIPFVSIGAAWYGAIGAIAGWGLGAVIFGVAAVLVCFRVIKDLERNNPPDAPLDVPAAGNSPFSTGKAAVLG